MVLLKVRQVTTPKRLIVMFCNIRLMLRNKADRATRALLREISRDNVDLFSSFESTKSVPTRTSSADSSVTGRFSFFEFSK